MSLMKPKKELFKECLKAKKDLSYDYIWTSNGKIYLQRDKDSSVVHVEKMGDLVKLQR